MAATMYEPSPADILLIDNSEDEAIITRMAFQRAGCPVKVHHARDGDHGLDFLHRRGAHSAAPLIDLVLLDLNMAGMDGRTVLGTITADPALRHVPVVVLSSSDYERDILDCYQLRCSSYLIKPIGLEEFTEALKTLYDYWFRVVQRPRVPRGR